MRITFKYLKILIIACLLQNAAAVECPAEGFRCDSNEFCDVSTKIPVTQQGQIISYPMADFDKIISTTNTNMKVLYIDGSLENGEYVMYATDLFQKYSMDESSTYITVDVKYKCTNSKEPKITYRIFVDDANVFSPEFSQEVYEHKISLPFVQGYECIFAKEIIATDKDLVYHKIKFSSENEFFDVTTSADTELNGHRSFAVLKLKKSLTEIDEKLEIEIKAEDNGNPARSSTAKIILTADKQKSLPIQPRFENAFNVGQLITLQNLQIGPIQLNRATYDDTLQFSISGEDAQWFDISNEQNIVTIRLKEGGVSGESVADKSHLAFTLAATNPELILPGHTAVFITLPKEANSNGVSFEKSIYRGRITDDQHLLEVETIKFVDENEETGYQFEIEADDKDMFHLEPGNKNEVKLLLNEDAVWEAKSFLYVNIVAKTNDVIRASTAVLISLPDTKAKFKFAAALFQGKINETNQMEPLEIEFVQPEDLSSIEFELKGAESDKFSVSKTEDGARVVMKNSEPELEWSKLKFLSFEIYARRNSLEIASAIVINLPTKVQMPQFAEMLYRGKILSKSKIDVPQIPIANLGHQFKLTGHNKFTIAQGDGIIQIQLDNGVELSEEDLQMDFIALTLFSESSKSATSIVLATPRQGIRPEFQQPYYKGVIEEDLKLQIDPIIFANEFDLMEANMEGADSKYFEVKTVTNGVMVQLKAPLTPEDIEGKKYFQFMVAVKTTMSLTNSVSVFIDLPFKCDDTPCPPCPTPEPTTPQPPDEHTPQFEKPLYRFSIGSDSIGVFGDVKALLRGQESDEISYSFGRIDDDLKSILKLHSNGSLALTAVIAPGKYDFQVLAEHPESDRFGQTVVVLDVSPINVCGDGNSRVENSLLIKTLKEEEPHYGILNAIEGECHYEILSIQPNHEDYFSINKSSNTLDMIKVDREDPLFSGMLVVQLQVILVLRDKNMNQNFISTSTSLAPSSVTTPQVDSEDSSQIVTEANDFSNSISNSTEPFNPDSPNEPVTPSQVQRRSRRDLVEDDRSYVLTNDIRLSMVQTVLNVIIEDINDNAPVFQYPPSGSDFTIGYPDVRMSNFILPEYLVKVHATDLDIGLNAVIRYKLENSEFGIDEKTGIIYPLSNAMKNLDTIKLAVYAIDRDGQAEGSLRTKMQIVVKKISPHQSVLLEFKRSELENIDELLAKASEGTGFHLKAIKWGVVPKEQTGKTLLAMHMSEKLYGFLRAAAANQETTVKVWAYALDDANKVVDSKTIIDKLSGSSDVAAESYEDNKKPSAERSVVGFIVGIVILSIICIGCIGFIAWLFYFRKILYEKMATPNRSDVSSFAPSLEANALELGKEELPQNSSYLKRGSVKIVGSTTQETSDYQTRIMEMLKDRENTGSENGDANGHIRTSSSQYGSTDDENTANTNSDVGGGAVAGGDRRKSVVKFNELVERIEIEGRRDSEISSERL